MKTLCRLGWIEPLRLLVSSSLPKIGIYFSILIILFQVYLGEKQSLWMGLLTKASEQLGTPHPFSGF